jgi:uncharacterized membrane protein YciS (DUF1049 family)
MLAFVKKVFIAVVLIVLVIFAYQNLQALSTGIRFQFDPYFREPLATPELPVVFLLAVLFLLGMLAAGARGMYEHVARRSELRSRTKRIRELEKELAELKARAAELRPPEAEGEPWPASGARPPAALPGGPEPAERISPPLRKQPSAPPVPPLEEEPTL